MYTRNVAEDVASRMLAQTGVVVVSDLHDAAFAAKRMGKADLAASLIEIADAAERLWRVRADGKAS